MTRQGIVRLLGGESTTRAPLVSAQPQYKSVPSGADETLSVSAVGNPAPNYQWRLNGAPIARATKRSFTLSGVATNQSGLYSVLISNSAGTITSSSALLSILPQRGLVAVFDHPSFVDTVCGGTRAEADNVQASLFSLASLVEPFTDIATGMSGRSVMVFPERNMNWGVSSRR